MSSIVSETATSDVVITSNNKIVAYGISLFDTATYTSVDITVTKDITGKIITVSPDVDLDATTDYIVMITELVDVKGQTLTNTVIEFTTAA